MIVEGTLAERDLTDEADVCIVGSGCGGGTLAIRLAEAGWNVVVLEQGGYYRPERGDFDQREDHMLARIDGARGLHTSEDGSIAFTYGNCVGGASVHYWADTYRTPADRLELWASKYGLAEHTLEQLTPHFERIEADLHVEPAPDHLLNPLNRKLEEALPRLGWHGHRVPQARKGCLGSGYCMQGCAYDAKQSQLVTTIPRAIALGARLYSDARALSFDTTSGTVTQIEVVFLDRARQKPNGKRLTVRAKHFVVAAGGFQTAALMLKQGLGRRLPALGKRLYCNPCVMANGLFPEPVTQWRGIPAGVGCDHFRLAKLDDRGQYIEGGYLLMPNQLQPMTYALVLPGVGAEHAHLMHNFPRLGGTIAWLDDEDPGAIVIDKKGNVRWHFSLGPNDKLRARDAMQKGAQWLFAAGATEVHLGDWARTVLQSPDEVTKIDRIAFDPAEVVLAGPHPAGAAPMGRSPEDSVVDSNHRIWGTDNLYIADPSVFPTAVSVDPSHTIMAFSHRLADLLLAH